MSTGPTTQATFIQGNQKTTEQDGSHSALFYLLQEVSRLASPGHSSVLGTHSPSESLDEASTPGGFIVETEGEDEHSGCDSFCQLSFSPLNQVNEVEEERHSSQVTSLIEPRREGASPLKVLSLINLQCDRILHQGDVEEPHPGSVSSKAKLGRSTLTSSTAAADVTVQGAGSDNYHIKRQEIQASVRDVEDVRGLSIYKDSQWRTKTPRKQPHPSRSVDIQDPDIQGVTFRMGSELDDSREQCRLLITSKYSKELFKCVRKPRLRTRTSQRTLKTCSSEEESDLTVSKDKVCASCGTRKTPMWRDAEDGTPLCNACGIRYKKYRVRCVNCWHIPRKEGNSNSCCLRCGNLVRLTSAQRKHTT
ncbi:unnamed protein product [Pleuronectes platessa]|uniref:GATA-type domain-containing protein n=1 Tax=Pleuronectes platessa TaxID=8262 RepID=A0A9N7U0H9_PLEPL|nr:unnamed protein product [Pleuronectes platessa]